MSNIEDIPSGWKQIRIKKIIKSLNAGVSVNSENRIIQNDEIGVLKTSCLNGHIFNPNEHKVIVENERNRANQQVIGNSIIISRMNTMELVGLSAYIPKDYPKLYLPDRLWQTEISDYKFDVLWLSYMFAAKEFREKIKSIATGTSGSMKNITKGDFLNLIILYPPLNEQRKIAEILSTWDEAIQTTEKLIDALEKRKKGLMQRLLTGQVRFPGFTEKWRKFKLEEYFVEILNKNKNLEVDLVLSCSKVHGIVPQSEVFGKRIASSNIENYKIVEKNDLVFDPNLLWDASIGFLEKCDIGVVSPVYTVLRLKRNTKTKYLFFKYLFQTYYYKEMYKVISQGTNVRRRNAPTNAFLDIAGTIGSVEEQNKIIDILEKCTNEIEINRKYLNNLKQQKQGLMQRLLTGQVRVRV